jgi:hypothetical protein
MRWNPYLFPIALDGTAYGAVVGAPSFLDTFPFHDLQNPSAWTQGFTVSGTIEITPHTALLAACVYLLLKIDDKALPDVYESLTDHYRWQQGSLAISYEGENATQFIPAAHVTPVANRPFTRE